MSRETRKEEPTRQGLWAAEGPPRLPALLLALVLGVELIALLAFARGFTTDDAYITLRYARHLAAGQGVTWNVGERPVEGYSNFSYVLIGAAALGSGLDPIVVYKGLGALSLAAVVALIAGLAAAEGALELGLAAGFAYLSFWGVTLWAASGLETPTYAALALGAIALAARGARIVGEGTGAVGRTPEATVGRADCRWLLASGGIVFLAAVTRPEGPLVGVAIAIGIVAEVARRRSGASRTTTTRVSARAAIARLLAPVAATGAGPYLVYSAWKWVHFGDLLPNSVRCKALWHGDPLALLRDAAPLVAWTLPFALWAVVRRPSLRRVALLSFGLLSLAILYRTDPIIGHANRHALAAWAALLAVAAAGVSDLLDLFLAPRRARVAATWILVIAAAAGLVNLEPRLRMLRQTAEAYSGRERTRRFLADWVDRRVGSDGRVLAGDCGVLGYFATVRIVDALCLNSWETPRPPIDRDAEAFARWVFQSPPEVLVLSSVRPDRLDPLPTYGVFPALARRPELSGRYRPALVAGRPGDDLFYFVYLRAVPPVPEPASAAAVQGSRGAYQPDLQARAR